MVPFPAPLAWLVDTAHAVASADEFLAGLGAKLVAAGAPCRGAARRAGVADRLTGAARSLSGPPRRRAGAGRQVAARAGRDHSRGAAVRRFARLHRTVGSAAAGSGGG